MFRFDPNAFPTHVQREAAKRVLCAIIQRSGGTFRGQTRLYKAFYWAHLHFWKNYSGMLTTYPIARLPQGPGVDQGEDLLFEMQCQDLIRVAVENSGQYSERVFTLIKQFMVNLTEEELAAVEHGLRMVENKTAKQVSDETHESSRSWKRLSNGKLMDIYEDLLTEDEIAAIEAANKRAKELASAVFD